MGALFTKRLRLSALFGVLLATTSGPARADHHEEGPCREDAKRLCAGIEPGEGRIVKCLKEHEAQVSPACKAKWDAKKAERKEHRLKKLEEKKAKIEQKIEETKKQ
jgi:hypothetical protein